MSGLFPLPLSSEDFGRIRTASDVSGRPRESSDVFVSSWKSRLTSNE